MLPADLHEEWEQDPAMATHLLAAADMYQLGRLARICEQRLCRSIDVDNAAHLLALAEQHQAHVGHGFEMCCVVLRLATEASSVSLPGRKAVNMLLGAEVHCSD